MGPATEKARRLSIEPVTRYRKLTVAGTQLLPSVGGRDTVVRQVQWSAAVQIPVNYHCQLFYYYYYYYYYYY